MTLTRREKDGTQPIIPYMVYLIKTDIILSENSDTLALFSARLKYQTLFQVVSDATKVDDLHHAVATKNSDSKKSLIQLYIFFIMKIKEVF